MPKNRLYSVFAVAALAGFAACGDAGDDANLVTQDTITTQGTEMVEVPVVDSSVVTTEIDVDTTVDVDTTSMP